MAVGIPEGGEWVLEPGWSPGRWDITRESFWVLPAVPLCRFGVLDQIPKLALVEASLILAPSKMGCLLS